ncbi:MAG: hypothetical protein RLZZ303_3342 [Candidatus Hydrogenedentota bacterium]|jgi:hypothetical protein
MAVKYECPKCGRRYIDWGAEKLGYKCPPTCPGFNGEEVINLIRVGAGAEFDAAVASLKRKPKKELVVAAPVEEGFDDVVDDEEVDDEELVEDAEEVVEEEVVADAVVADDEIVDEDADEEVSGEEDPEDLDFGTEKVDFDEGPVQEFED